MLFPRMLALNLSVFSFFLPLTALGQEPHEDGIGEVNAALERGDIARALEIAIRLAEDEDLAAQIGLGELYLSGPPEVRNPQEAAKWFKRAAQQGDETARFYLGLLYSSGLGVTKNEHIAVEIWEPLALAGDAEAAFELGKLYDPGYFEGETHRITILGQTEEPSNDVVRDSATIAVRWYRIAAEAGAPGAQHNLGNKYAHGDGVPINYEEAARYFREAARQGEPLSQTNLGALYAEGMGVRKDVVKSYMWSSIAAAAGQAQAQVNIEAIKDEMTPAQVAEAQELAEQCVTTHFKSLACE